MPSLEVLDVPAVEPHVPSTAMEIDDEDADDDRTVEMEEDDVGTTKEAPSASPKDVSSPKKRNVTPSEESNKGAKKQQQKKASQQPTLSYFFSKTQQTSSPTLKAPDNKPKTKAPKTKLQLSTVRPEKKPDNDTGKKGCRNTSKKVALASKKEIPMSTSPTKEFSTPMPEKEVKEPGNHDTSVAEPDTTKMEASTASSEPKNSSATGASTSPAGDATDGADSESNAKSDEPTGVLGPTGKEEEKDSVEPELSPERQGLLKKYQNMKGRYEKRAKELVKEGRAGLEEEYVEMPDPKSFEIEQDSDQEFSDPVVANMVLLIEGSSLPLTMLVTLVSEKLEECHQKKWSQEAVTAKIKLLGTRKSFMSSTTSRTNLFEDANNDRMWRWETITPELLPTDVQREVRKARAARKKLSSHYTSILKLVKSIEDAEKAISDVKRVKLDAVLAKISRDEEKVLKFEREAEKQRLAQNAKRKKQEELEAKKREKEQQAEEKKKEKERKKEERKLEKEKEKQEAQNARDEAKRKRAEEQKKKDDEQKRAEQAKLNKQKACMMSFFATGPATSGNKSDPSSGSPAAEDCTNKEGSSDVGNVDHDDFDSDKFWSMIDSASGHDRHRPLFPKLSSQAKASRKRRTRNVTVSVFVTVVPEENVWDAQPFAEQQDIVIPNKYRFLSFHEDCRPPYHGTWSKKSTSVTGRNPLAKDTACLDYDYDSEAEWEEGDDEIGEDVEDDTKNQDEEEDEADADAKVYDYDDGFCVADDQYLETDENIDDEARALYKKRLQVGGDLNHLVNRISIIAPSKGGIPVSEAKSFDSTLVEGFDKKEGLNLLVALKGKTLLEENLWLDAFPPPMIDEDEASPDTNAAAGQQPGGLGKDEYTDEEMRIFVRFAHHSDHNSKDKLIEELRASNPKLFSSRAKATRKLDLIAVKYKHPNGGVYWDVKKEILEELGLQDLLEKEIQPTEVVEEKKEQTTVDPISEKPEQKKKRGRPKAKKVPEADSKGSKKARAEPKKATEIKASPKNGPTKKSPPPGVTAASANLMASFLIRPKKKAKVEQAVGPPSAPTN